MTSDQRVWPFLSRRTAGRLRFFPQPETEGDVGIPCRLPGCTGTVDRSPGAGRTKWFHDRKCVDAFRTRQHALDAAITELADLALTSSSTERELAAIRSDLDWLLDVRSTYVAPGSWRQSTFRDDLSSASAIDYIDSIQQMRAPKDPCPTCDGTGDLWPRRAPAGRLAELRQRIDLLASLAPKLLLLLEKRPGIETADALDTVRRWAIEAEAELRRSLSPSRGEMESAAESPPSSTP